MTAAAENLILEKYPIYLPELHRHQELIVKSLAKRKIVRAGRRGGKTVGAADEAVEDFYYHGRRVLYAVPTSDQLNRFWVTVKNAFREPIDAGVLYKNETEHIIEIPGTETRIRAKTAWNADTLRGDYADKLILDEFQLMSEDVWDYVGAPMLLDNNGDALFIYTPPSLTNRSVTKARDPLHAAKRYVKYQTYQRAGNVRYAAFHFGSIDNPHISKSALREITEDMTQLSYRMEILAEDINEAPGALWQRTTLDLHRVIKPPDNLDRIVVAIDPSTTTEGEEAGITASGRNGDHAYVLADNSLQGSPLAWATEAVRLYRELSADCVVAESNQGGEMVSTIIGQVDGSVPVKLVHATRGKRTRGEPVAARYEQGRVHHVGSFPALESEMCMWVPGDPSPNRMDSLVWGLTELLLGTGGNLFSGCDLS